MLTFLADNIGTILVSVILIAIVVLIVLKICKDKKKGKNSCGCACKNCPSAGMCHQQANHHKT